MDETTTPTALCVGVDVDELPADLRAALGSFTCDQVNDVYRALVRVARSTPDVVIVAIDWLPGVALEFFDLVARTQRELPVLVIGSQRASAKIDDALRRGATGIATAEAIAQLLAPPSPAMHPHDDQPETASTPDRKKPDTFASTGNVLDAELDRRLCEQADADAASGAPADNGGRNRRTAKPSHVASRLPDAAHGASPIEPSTEADTSREPSDDARQDLGARVPWQRYVDRPQRVPPQRTPPTIPDSVGPDAVEPDAVMPDAVMPDAVDPDPPLLTAEEIAALMGD